MDKKLLIIEEKNSLSKLLLPKLKDLPITTIESDTSEDGLKMALADHPDLILIEDMMTDMTGFIVLDRLRKDAWGSKVPVFFFADDVKYEGDIKSLAGNYEFFLKPAIITDSLVLLIKQKLKV